MNIYYSSEWYHRRPEMVGRPHKVPLPPIDRRHTVRGGQQYSLTRKARAIADKIEAIIRRRKQC